MQQYLDLVKEVLRGTRKENRTGVDTLSTFNINYEVDLRNGFPLLTTKKINWFHIVAENLWFITGSPKIDFLKKHGIKFWDAWADDKNFVPSAYGNFWRRFPTHGNDGHNEFNATNDQLSWVIEELKRNPMSRRLVVSAWAPGNAQTSKLPPCHVMFIFNVQNAPISDQAKIDRLINECYDLLPIPSQREPDSPQFRGLKLLMTVRAKGGEHADPRIKDIIYATETTLNLHLTQRSCDVALGVPYNVAGYAFILSLVAHLVGIKPGIFAHTLVDAHVYTSKPDGSMSEFDHVPGLVEQLSRKPKDLPTLKISDDIKTLDDISALCDSSKEEILQKFQLLGYDPHPAIKFKVAV